MRLAQFIELNIEPILEDWSAFASTVASARAMNLVALRDHAAEMLRDIVCDVNTPESEPEEQARAKGNFDTQDSDPDTAAENNGAGRAEDGFSVEEMASEYRALRASVLRRWARSTSTITTQDFEDVMRFNASIDQSYAEALKRYNQNLEGAKEMFVAVLGHDLRVPLSAVTMASMYIRDSSDPGAPHHALNNRVLSSATRMAGMVDDLLDFTQGRLGGGIPVERRDTDLGVVAHDAVGEVVAAHPTAVIKLATTGDLRGAYDAARISQVLTNLLSNAVQYGTPNAPIHVRATGEPDSVVLRVQNSGPVIPPARLAGLFSPFKRLRRNASARRPMHNLGLGLYIVERIVTAHSGTIDVASDSAGTEFVVRLPRAPEAAFR